MYKELIKWSKANYSSLPWRKERDLYSTLVSEIMLQQTTVATVMNHYDRFIKKFPNLESLAKTNEEQMQIAWKGLGYYRRARNLRNAAINIVNEHGGEIPLRYDELINIPGIGDYTARALISIGANKKDLAIDANLERVLSRLYGIKEAKGKALHQKIHSLFANGEIKIPRGVSSRAFNEALMDLGRTFCQARKVSCDICPCRKECRTFTNKKLKPLEFPFVAEKKKMKYYDLKLLRIIVRNRGKLLGYEKGNKEWLHGQLEIPTFVIHSEDETLKQYPKLTKKVNFKSLPYVKTSITKYRITNYILELSRKEFEAYSKAAKYTLHSFTEENKFSTASIKSLRKIDG